MTFRIPIFPLPNVVFFPYMDLPVHIFEPRYRQMVADCLAGDRRLAMVLLKPGWEPDYYSRPPVCPVAGAGEIVECQRLGDGRYNILLRGVGRIGIEGEAPSEKLYRIAVARWLHDIYPAGGEQALASRAERLRQAYGRLVSRLPKPVPRLLRVLSDQGSPGILVDRIIAEVIGEVEQRQRLLEIREVAARIAEVTDYLEGAVARQAERDPQWQAKWN